MRNRVFCVVCLLFLFGPLLYGVLGFLQPQVRSASLNVEVEYLTGEKVDARFAPPLSISDMASGKTQRYIEQYVGGCIPAKAMAMLASSSLQRGAITLSNAPMGFECYPTFYGSDVLYLPEHRALMRTPDAGNGVMKERIAEFCDGLESWVLQHPDVQVNLVLADISERSSLNPAAELVAADFFTSDVFELFKTRFESLDAVRLGYVPYASLDEYFSDYYSTDHHWNGFGAIRTLDSLEAQRYGRSDASASIDSRVRGNGSLSRSGLDLLNESLVEPLLATEDLTIRTDGYSVLLLASPEERWQANPLSIEFNFYHEWYGASANCVISNDRDANASNALVIGDSYSSAFQWLVARDNVSVSTYLDMHGAYKGSETLDDRLAAAGAKTVYFVGCMDAFSNLLQCYPNYFVVK